MEDEDQYVVLRYWKPLLGNMCVSAASGEEASTSLSIRVFMISQGRVGPGRIMPVKKDIVSEDRFSSGAELASGERSLRMVSTATRLGHFIARANFRRALTWAFFDFR
jgi:hypothetical protein